MSYFVTQLLFEAKHRTIRVSAIVLLLACGGSRADDLPGRYVIPHPVSATAEFQKIDSEIRSARKPFIQGIFANNEIKFSVRYCDDLALELPGSCQLYDRTSYSFQTYPVFGPQSKNAHAIDARDLFKEIGLGNFEIQNPVEMAGDIGSMRRYQTFVGKCSSRSAVDRYEGGALKYFKRLTFEGDWIDSGLRGTRRLVDYDRPGMLQIDQRRRATENFALWELSVPGHDEIDVLRAERFEPFNLSDPMSLSRSIVLQNGMMSVFVGKNCEFLDQIPYSRSAQSWYINDGNAGFVEPGHSIATILNIRQKLKIVLIHAIDAVPKNNIIHYEFFLSTLRGCSKTLRMLFGEYH